MREAAVMGGAQAIARTRQKTGSAREPEPHKKPMRLSSDRGNRSLINRNRRGISRANLRRIGSVAVNV